MATIYFVSRSRNVEKHNQTYQNKTRFGQLFFNSTLLDKETPERTSIQKRYHLIQETLSASSIPSSFPEALDTCFGGELLGYANLTPTLELDAERTELREKTPNVGCQNNRDRALGNVRIPKLKSECSMRGTCEWSNVLFVDRSQKKKGSLWPMREACPLNRGNLFLIVKRVISFFCAHGTYARRRTAKHYEFGWGKPINEGENGHPFFWCTDTA